MTSAKTRAEFEAVWNEHADQLNYLAHSLPASYLPELGATIKKFKALVIVAAANTYSVDGVLRTSAKDRQPPTPGDQAHE